MYQKTFKLENISINPVVVREARHGSKRSNPRLAPLYMNIKKPIKKEENGRVDEYTPFHKPLHQINIKHGSTVAKREYSFYSRENLPENKV